MSGSVVECKSMYTVPTFIRGLEQLRRCDAPEFLDHFRSGHASRWAAFLEEVLEYKGFRLQTHGMLLAEYLPGADAVELLCHLSDKASFLRCFETPGKVSRLYQAIDLNNRDHSLFLRWAIHDTPKDLGEVAAMFDILLSGGEIEQ